ncbi:hypothetical protein A2773_03785 [Candidatus Gottesmanbacteria bacterium RIFCSPHIGHO2_01_FULL_39_10]|uniref:DUF304 domain-containing protein n=1 Tax=Candidatus Gottesmanbacteria bacterium RIFCSPHIGHO2_01_FULL_39_10 TaxID=1798375 RepID=A0A1F5ZMZ8_9BACT|nr:MAG: hypothetical protein A2773_03785 [Candidatus Gottesmanbacteria bacterium RIFCSPHIGHO2_01_FULL_39_10]
MPDIFTLKKDKNKTPAPKLSSKKKETSSTSQLFSAYSFMPTGVRFDTQEVDETIVLLLRRHWITNLSWLITGFILLILPLFLFSLGNITSIFPSFFPPTFTSFIILIWYLLTFTFILTEFLLWYFNVSIVTQERIIDVDFALLYKVISETRISRVEDVSARTGGFIRSFFDYGDVFVQTAATEENFEFLAVPHPNQVVKIINELVGREEEEGHG